MRTKSIDIHQHFPGTNKLDARVQACADAGIVKQVLLGLPESRVPGDNAGSLEASRLFPDLFIPFYGLEMDADTPDNISRARDRGFVGVKCIAPRRPYNDPAYFPLYERCAELELPVLYHLGIVANNKAWNDCDSNLMRAIHLDHIARMIPQLTIIGAHFGNPWSDEAGMACRWNPNLFFDFSGSLLKYRSPQFLGDLLWWQSDGPYSSPDKTTAWQKICFGTDVNSDLMEDVRQDHENLMNALNLTPELRHAIWYGTAAKILKLAPEV
ncbi:MAG: amidohydrolase family protein [Lentisphaerae bacterium]|nr:amidohydrolase family protein [Lentisphaerota bacterium]